MRAYAQRAERAPPAARECGMFRARPLLMNHSTFYGVNGTKLFFRSWHPHDGRPRGLVVIVPGFKAHSGYYEWVAEQLTRDGLAVYSLDLRGRGQSDGERFYVESFADYVD